MKKSNTGKIKGKTKVVQPVKNAKKGDTGKIHRSRRGTNPLVVLVLLPLALGTCGFLGWYYYKYGHFPLFATQEQRDKTLAEAQGTWADISDTTKKQWNITKSKWDELDKKFSTEYEQYQKDQSKRRQETAFLLDDAPAKPAPVVAPRKTAQRIFPLQQPTTPVPPPPVGTAHPVLPKGTEPGPTPVEPPSHPLPGPTTPGPDVGTPAPPIAPPPPAKPAYDPTTDTNYKAAVSSYDAAFSIASQGDSAQGDAAIKAYTEAIAKLNAATDSWQLVVEKCKTENVPSAGIEKSIASCADNRKIWEENIAAVKKAEAEPPPATSGGTTATTGSGFYDNNPKWIEGKKAFKEGYEIFTEHISKGTGQSSHVLNGFIDKAVERFNKAEELWTAAEDEWLKKYPGTSGPKADAEMLDKAMNESQFFRYGCMKMHTFER